MYQDTREHERNRRTYAVPESQQRNLRHRRYCGIAESSYAQREWNEDRGKIGFLTIFSTRSSHKEKVLYILELTIGIETNIQINSERKASKYYPL